jgi:hypothetical protein
MLGGRTDRGSAAPLFRQPGFHRITAAGHKDKALEFGKDVWMKYTLPTLHVLYFGIQTKKRKLDSAGVSKAGSSNIGEILNQVTMMLGHEIFDPELNRRVLVDHAFIGAGGEITKQAKNWLGERLDATKRSQVTFMDRDDILNLFVVTNLPPPKGALPAQGLETAATTSRSSGCVEHVTRHPPSRCQARVARSNRSRNLLGVLLRLRERDSKWLVQKPLLHQNKSETRLRTAVRSLRRKMHSPAPIESN